jgi:hypothetical protein
MDILRALIMEKHGTGRQRALGITTFMDLLSILKILKL